MLLKIVQTGELVLRQRARDLTKAEIESAEIQTLIELMRETMRDAPGVGLAAPQIAQPLQLAVIEDVAAVEETERSPVPFHVIINPRLTLHGEVVEFFEGCLSVDGFQAVVPRAHDVTVEALDHRGEPISIKASGWYARILQHEIDHLNGVLYIDRMHTRTFCSARNAARVWQGQKPSAVLAAVGQPR
ncbi:MAG TPA: peptide deformylase [Polyangia bacterium]|jgi:peptide deformylase|nr:peptide deformylase [Polyangia bacterium]